MKRFVCLIAILMLLIAACTTDSTPIPPTAIVTPATTPEEVPVDLSGVVPGTFRVTYNDPANGQFTTFSGEADYSHISNLSSGFSMTLTRPNAGPNDAFVVVAIPENITPGTYHLIDYNAAFSADNRTIQVMGTTLAGAANYFELHEGSITIQTVNPITAAFKFSGIAEIDETHSTTVEVNGTINAAPYVEIKPGS